MRRLTPRVRPFLRVLVAGVFVLCATTGALGLTLEEVVRAALNTNPDILLPRDDVRIAEQETRQAQAGYYPSLDLRGATGPQRVDNPTNRSNADYGTTLWRSEAGVTLRQMLY